MDKLPTAIIQYIYIYEYGSSYKDIFDTVLTSLNIHCFMYRCDQCFKQYNQCFCCCQTCRTYLRFCRQLYFKDGDMTEDDLEDIVGLGFN